MKVTVYCKNHIGSRVRLLDGTVKYKDWNDNYVTEASESASSIELDEANTYCEGDVLKAEHELGYYFVV